MHRPADTRYRQILRAWRTPLTLAAVLVVVQATGLRQALEYERTAVLRGQLWRLITGNLVHLGAIHLSRDLAGLLLIWALLGDSLTEGTSWWVLGLSALAVGIGLLLFSPGILWYVGISGVLFGLFCAGALCQLPQRPMYAGALLLGMATIIAWTLHAGALPGETVGLGGRVVPQAHLYGAVGGAAVVSVRAMLRPHRRLAN